MGGRGHRVATGAATLATCALAWLAGVALHLQQPALWPRPVNTTLLVVAALLVLTVWRVRRHVAGAIVLLLAVAVLGWASTSERAEWRLADRLAPELEGQDLVVSGTVAQMPRHGAGGTRFVFDTDAASLRGLPVRVPATLSLGWYRERDDDASWAAAADGLRAGQRWRFTLRLRQPHGSFNPQGFDLELWLFERGIGGNGTVRAAAGEGAPQLLGDTPGWGLYRVERARQAVRDAIELQVPDPATAGVLAALAVGDQGAIDREGWDLFRVTGVAHLMSISGLHVTMFAWLAGGLIARLWRLHPRLMLAVPAPLAARWGGLLLAAAYALLAGWGVPAQRTVWMIAVVALLRSAGLRWPLHRVLLLAGAAVVLVDPWALLQPGFWLSFVAVALLVASEPVHATRRHPDASAGRRARLWRTVRDGLRTQAVATVGLAPLSLLFFQQLSLVGFVANLVAIPLVTLLITPLSLLGIVLPPLWTVAAALVQGLVQLLQALAAWPLALWTAAAAPPWAVAAGLLAGALAVLPLSWRLRALALPLMLPLLWPPLPRPAPGQFELVAADVGQGSAVLVRTRQHLLLFDTGPQTSPDNDAGARVLLPLRRGRGEHRIDLLVLSHRDTDHVGGAASVLAALPVRQMLSSLGDGHPLRARGVPHRRCDAGQAWQWDGVRFDVLHPLAEDHAVVTKPNALSCVLRVQGASGSVLLAGDIEAAQETALRLRDPAALRADVLLVPHHGSRTSSTAGFIAAVQPQVALVQAGYRNRFGHPAPDVVARYTRSGVHVIRSDRCGAWTRQADGLGLCQRELARRYWHHRFQGPARDDP